MTHELYIEVSSAISGNGWSSFFIGMDHFDHSERDNGASSLLGCKRVPSAPVHCVASAPRVSSALLIWSGGVEVEFRTNDAKKTVDGSDQSTGNNSRDRKLGTLHLVDHRPWRNDGRSLSARADRLVRAWRFLRLNAGARPQKRINDAIGASQDPLRHNWRLPPEPRPPQLALLGASASVRQSAKEAQRMRRHRQFMSGVAHHAESFWAFHRLKYDRLRQVGRQIRSRQIDTYRERQKEEDREEKARLRALRANDMDAYMKLVQNTKNERLNFLLNETNKFLDDLGSRVASQQQDASQDPSSFQIAGTDKAGKDDEDEDDFEEGDEEEGDGEDEEEEDDNEGGDAPAPAEKKTRREGTEHYYALAHRIREPITRQPRMLRGGTLKEYQLAGVEWLVSLYNNHLNGILADEMGLGKTIQTIGLLAYIMEVKNNKGPFLIVVPLSTLSNWASELARWAPDMFVVRYHGTGPRRKQIYRDQMSSGLFNVVLTTYEYVMRDKSVLSKIFWQYIIIDEGHRMKNADSKFTRILGSAYSSRNRLLLTGTPLQNNLPELWSLMNFLLPKIFGATEGFDQWFAKPFANFRGTGPGSGGSNTPGAGASSQKEATAEQPLTNEERLLIINRLHQMLRPFLLRRMKRQVLHQLPDKVERIVRCDISEWQKEWYNQIREHGTIGLNSRGDMLGGGRGMRSLNNAVMHLRKVCNHPFLFLKDGYQVDHNLIRASGKFAMLDQILPKLRVTGHRVLIFSQMTQMMDILDDYMAYRGYRHLRLDGKTAADQRAEYMAMFNRSDSPYFVFVLSTRAGGLGVNLASADTVILFDSDWNPTMDAQAQDRAHRIGQTQEVRVLRLVTNTPVEDQILARATDKSTMGAMVIEAGEFNEAGHGAKAADRRRTVLESLIQVDPDANGGEQALMDPEQLNEILAREEDEFALFQRMDRQREEAENKAQEEGGYTGRLMTKRDVPEWVYQRPDTAEEYGQSIGESLLRRPRRKRERVSYAEDLTDKEYLDLVDAGADAEEIAQHAARKRRRVERREERERARARARGRSQSSRDRASPHRDRRGSSASESEGSEEDDSSAFSGRSSPRARSDGRKLTLSLSRGKTTGNSSGNGAGTAGGENRDMVAREVDRVLRVMESVTDPKTGRQCTLMFRTLPSRQLYPDYFVRVPRPIAMDDIRRRGRQLEYPSLETMWRDVCRMVVNAHIYNPPGHWVCHDALRLQAAAAEVLGPKVAPEESWEAREAKAVARAREEIRLRGSSSAAAAAAAASSESDATPQQREPQRRLILSLDRSRREGDGDEDDDDGEEGDYDDDEDDGEEGDYDDDEGNEYDDDDGGEGQ